MFISLKQKNIILITFLTSPLSLFGNNILNKNKDNIFYFQKKEILVEKKKNQVSWINDINLSFKYNNNYNDIYKNGSDDYTSVNLTIRNKIFDSSIYNALFNSDVIKNVSMHNLNKNKLNFINTIYLKMFEYQKNKFIIDKYLNTRKNLSTDRDILFNNKILGLNTELDINQIELKILNIDLNLENLKDDNHNILNFLHNNSSIKYDSDIERFIIHIIEILNKEMNKIDITNSFEEQEYNNKIKLKNTNINVEKYKKFGYLEVSYSYSYQKDPYQFRIITKDENFKHNHNLELKYNIPLYSIKSNMNSELLRVQKLKLLSEQSFNKSNFKNNKDLFHKKIESFNKRIEIITKNIIILEKIHLNNKADYENNLIIMSEMNKSNNSFENGILDLQIEKNKKYTYILNYLKSFNISY